MGNRIASTQPSTDAQVDRDLRVLCDANLPQQQRRPAFDRLRAHFAPLTASGPDYATELQRVFSLRFEPWPAPPEGSWLPERAAVLADHVRGCIYGAALGDAAGLATEFLPKTTVLEHYGEAFHFLPGCEVYADSHRMAFPSGDWTDDTDQLLLLLQTFLEAGGRADARAFAGKLKSWHEHGFPGLGDQGGAGMGQHTKAVMQHTDFLVEPARAARAVWEQGNRKSAANGAVMRTAVAGVPRFWDVASVREAAEDFCTATHTDPRCVASCVAVANAVALVLQAVAADTEVVIDEVLAAMIREAEQKLDSEEARMELQQHAAAESLEELHLDDPRVMGYTFKCLGCGMWALRCGTRLGFQEALQRIVLEGGDADTNACVAGALLGCYTGYRQLPAKWISGMPYVAWLEAWVQKLLYMLQLPVVAQTQI